MLAALIATRLPPAPPIFFYTNQIVAATNTFVCITVCRRAAYIATNQYVQRTLSLSIPGAESILDHMNRLYYQIINAPASNANIISTPANLYLSDRIAEVIAVATILTGVLVTLPVSPANAAFKVRLQNQLALALANLKALGKRIN